MISTDPLKKALAALKRSLDQPKDEFTRNSTIQCFEFSYELSWKLLKRYFKKDQGIEGSSVRSLFREAGKQGIVESVEAWFDYHEARNLTSHTYNEDTADSVYESAKLFYLDSIALLEKMEKLIED